jgi:hypothetical protein
MTRAIVASFHKDSGGRLKLWSVSVTEEKSERHGRTYLSRNEYDIEWSRTYGYLFHYSGGGGHRRVIPVDGIYFVSGEVQVKEGPTKLVDWRDKPPWRSRRTRAIRKRNRTRRLHALPRAFVLEPGQDLLDWLHLHAIKENSVYCSVCRDHLPESSLCGHVWWCDKTGQWSTQSERCSCKDRDECYGAIPCGGEEMQGGVG